MVLGPSQIHPQEHLGPVRRLGASGPSADGQDGGTGIIRTREQELAAGSPEVGLQPCGVTLELGLELGIPTRFIDQLDERQELVGAVNEAPPQAQLGAQGVGFAEDALGRLLIVPKA
jgi:hypothetical protein